MKICPIALQICLKGQIYAKYNMNSKRLPNTFNILKLPNIAKSGQTVFHTTGVNFMNIFQR